MRLSRRSVETAEHPDQQQDRDRNAEQPKKPISCHRVAPICLEGPGCRDNVVLAAQVPFLRFPKLFARAGTDRAPERLALSRIVCSGGRPPGATKMANPNQNPQQDDPKKGGQQQQGNPRPDQQGGQNKPGQQQQQQDPNKRDQQGGFSR
jgi:hypothetical protein